MLAARLSRLINSTIDLFLPGLKQMKATMILTRITLAGILLHLLLNGNCLVAQPVRDPHTPGYVTARELPDGTVPSPDSNGNFIIGPTHSPAREMMVNAKVPQGAIYQFTMNSQNS